MKQRGGCLWLLVGLFLAVVAGGLAFTAILKATSAEPTSQAETLAPVVVVARDVPPRTEIKPEDLITRELPLSAIPDNAVRDQQAAIGKVTTSQLIAGEILLKPRIAEPGTTGSQVNFKIEPGKVVMAFPADDLMSQAGVLQPGDIIDFLYTIQVKHAGTTGSSVTAGAGGTGGEKTITFWGLQKVSITAVVLPSNTRIGRNKSQSPARPKAILLALDPQDALLLKHLKDTNSIVDIVLRAREDDKKYETQPVTEKYLEQEYNLTPALSH
jgi:pilus assembly protein CpaB